jgi:hypothetical protein
MNEFTDNQLVKKCLLAIEEKLEWGGSDEWRSEDFTELSEKIHGKTGVLLSQTTLKRVWGKVTYESAPSISTLNALAQYLDFGNWREFKNSQPYKRQTPKFSISVREGLFMVGGILLISFLVGIVSMDRPSKQINLSKKIEGVTFTSRPLTNDLPNTVVFDFDLNNIKSDSLFIQQYWDPTKTIQISHDQKQATGMYYYPGYFRAKLLIEGKIVLEHDLFIQTGDWVGTIDYEPVPKYLEGEEILDYNGLKFKEHLLSEIIHSESHLYSTYHLVEDFGYESGDDFILKTTFRNSYNEKWAVCQFTRVFLLGSKGAIIIPFVIPGCVSEIGVMLNDKYISGKENDLSAFGVEHSEYRNFEIKVFEKNIDINVDGKSIFKDQYSESMGKLVGVRYKFLGAGEVKDLQISDSDGRVYLEELF